MSRINKFERERHQLITQLLQQVTTLKDRQQKMSAINQIAAVILRSRPLCSRFKGTPLTGIYQEIYLQVKEQLKNHIYDHLFLLDSAADLNSGFNSKYLSPIYLCNLQTTLFQKNLNDQQLKKMGLAAQSFLVNSELRTYALNELVKAIKLSRRLCKPHAQKFSASLYSILYEEALNETLCYICLNIDLYDPDRGNKKFMNWVNFKLDKSILKCYEKRLKYSNFEIPSSESLEQIRQPVAAPDLTQILREYLTLDPEQIFRTTYIRNRPDASFSTIALAKFSGQSWEDISRQLKIPIPTLSSFYNRWCRRFTPLLNTELKKYF